MNNCGPEHEEVNVLVHSLVDLLAANAYVAWTNTCIGNQAPVTKHYFQRMYNPELGDLVCEITNWNAPAINRIGRLISLKMEEPPPEVLSKDEYDAEKWGKPWPPYLERVWRIETLDGREYRWWNADFLVVPEDPFEHQGRLPKDTPDPSR